MNDMSEPQGKVEARHGGHHPVLKLLPHRYPFLMVDRIYDMDGDESCVGIKNVTINEPFFQGHFPQFPGHAGRAHHRGAGADGGRLCVQQPRTRPTSRSSSISWGSTAPSSASRCCPGDQLHYHVKKIRNRGRAWRFYGEAKVNGQVVAEAEVSAMLADPDAAHRGGKHG